MDCAASAPVLYLVTVGFSEYITVCQLFKKNYYYMVKGLVTCPFYEGLGRSVAPSFINRPGVAGAVLQLDRVGSVDNRPSTDSL